MGYHVSNRETGGTRINSTATALETDCSLTDVCLSDGSYQKYLSQTQKSCSGDDR